MHDTATAPPGSSRSRPGAPVRPIDVRALLESLAGADPLVVDNDELRALIASASQVRGWLDAFEIQCVRRSRQLADDGRGDAPKSMLKGPGNRSDREAAKVEEGADVLDELGGVGADSGSIGSDPTGDGSPDAADSFERAFQEGRITSGHLNAMADAMQRLDADTRAEFAARACTLLAAALSLRVDVFARMCRELARRLVADRAASDAEELDRQRANSVVKRWVDKITGMCVTHLELDPVRDAALWSAVDSILATMRHNDGNANTPWSQMQVNAFVAAVTLGSAGGLTTPGAGGDTGGSPGDLTSGDESDTVGEADDLAHARRVPEITILTDLQTLISGLHARGICETDNGEPLPVSTVRRLCCDAEIIPMVLGTDGVPLDVGRSARSVTPHQRRALRAMYRTCAHPDCTVPFSACKAHHIRWWWRDLGPTDLDNLIPLCERHHHLVHEGGWTLTMTPDRVTTWTRPDGVVAHHGSTTDRMPALHSALRTN